MHIYSAQQGILWCVYSEEWLGYAIEMLFYIYLFCECGHEYHGACMEAKGQLVWIFSLFLCYRVWGLNSGWWQVPLHTKSSVQPSADTFLHTNPFKVKTCHRYQFSNFWSAQSIPGIYSHRDRQYLTSYFWLVFTKHTHLARQFLACHGNQGSPGPTGQNWA